MPDNPREFRYFLDYDKETDSTNVFAAITNYGLYRDEKALWTGTGGAEEPAREPSRHHRKATMEGFGATFFRDNSGVSWCGAAREALGPEIPESVARKLHPRLFERMERPVPYTGANPYR